MADLGLGGQIADPQREGPMANLGLGGQIADFRPEYFIG
jgi:hypothetical protein